MAKRLTWKGQNRNRLMKTTRTMMMFRKRLVSNRHSTHPHPSPLERSKCSILADGDEPFDCGVSSKSAVQWFSPSSFYFSFSTTSTVCLNSSTTLLAGSTGQHSSREAEKTPIATATMWWARPYGSRTFPCWPSNRHYGWSMSITIQCSMLSSHSARELMLRTTTRPFVKSTSIKPRETAKVSYPV